MQIKELQKRLEYCRKNKIGLIINTNDIEYVNIILSEVYSKEGIIYNFFNITERTTSLSIKSYIYFAINNFISPVLLIEKLEFKKLSFLFSYLSEPNNLIIELIGRTLKQEYFEPIVLIINNKEMNDLSFSFKRIFNRIEICYDPDELTEEDERILKIIHSNINNSRNYYKKL